MIDSLKPYPAMKNSGVPWLGEMPVGWEIRRNGRLFAQRIETGFPDLRILEVSLRTGVRVRSLDASARKQVMADRAKYKRAADGDIAYNMMRMWQGAVGVVPMDGLISPAYVVARPFPGTVSGYFAYLYRTNGYMGEVDNYSRGIVKDRNRLYWEQFKQIPTPCPPPAEQTAIVRFLDHADRRIRRYIRAKQKLIKLLEEQKQAIIHRAVTRGLDPNVRLKPSGLPWCPMIPEHWELNPNRAYLRQRKVLVGERHSEYILLSLTKRGVIVRDLTDNKGKFSADMGTSQEVSTGDLVMCLFDVPETPRTVGLSKHDGMITGAYTVFDVQDKQVAHWLELFYLAMDNLKALSPLYSGLRNTIQKPRFLGTKTPVPPLTEQAAIVEFLAQATANIDSAVSRAERETKLLNEYRTRLIADVVTGKLDVRDAAARLPHEVDEPEPLDEIEAEGDADEAAVDDADEVAEEAEA